MKKTLVRIQKDVPLTIFDEPALARRVNELFNGAEKKVKRRIDEILKFLKMDSVDELSYENITILFKENFFKSILNEAVEITFAGQRNYDILSNISFLLSEERLENAIMGEIMINAFSRAIRSVPVNSALSACLNGNKILLLEKEFLGKSILQTTKNKKKNSRKNYCEECGCYCTCNGDCNGDVNKCTSKKAIKEECNHCCICYVELW